MAFSRTEALRQAEQQAARGNLASAITIYRKLLHANPLDLLCVSAIGDLHLKDGTPNKAIEYFTQMVDDFLRLGSKNNAIYVIKRILQLDPHNVAANLKLGDLYLQDGEAEKAHDCFIEAGARLSQQGKLDAALDASRKALLANPASRQAKAALAGLEAEIQQPAFTTVAAPQQLEAIYISIPDATPVTTEESFQDATFLPEAASSAPPAVRDDKTVIQNIAQAEMLVGYGKIEEAIACLKDILWERPDFIDVRVRLKDIYLRASLFDRAADECINIAGLYAALGNRERARDYIVRARLIVARTA